VKTAEPFERFLTRTLAERFFGRILPHPVTGCWNWLGGKTNGYGSFWADGEMTNAHRFSYIVFVGDIPAGHDVDHLCRNRGCCNPEHLEAVTRKVNMARGELRPPSGAKSKNGKKTTCPRGHPYDGANKWSRTCSICQKTRNDLRYRGRR